MTIQELQQDAIKRRKDVLDAILAEFEEFGVTGKTDVSKDYDLVNFRVLISSFFFDFRIDFVRDKLMINAYTHKTLLNTLGIGDYPLTMGNIDELLMAIKSYENVYVPKFK